MSEFRKIPCVIQRGGTSKGIYLHERDLPQDSEQRTKVILSIFGSPDKRQIDGLGGADPLTSKVAIISPSTRSDCDIDYTFGAVDLTEPLIDYRGTAGTFRLESVHSLLTRGWFAPLVVKLSSGF